MLGSACGGLRVTKLKPQDVLTLGELLDIELCLSSDTMLGFAERRARDDAVALKMRRDLKELMPPRSDVSSNGEPVAGVALLRSWLQALRRPNEATPGQKLDRSLRVTDLRKRSLASWGVMG